MKLAVKELYNFGQKKPFNFKLFLALFLAPTVRKVFADFLSDIEPF